jgi:RNA-binding protein
MCYKALKECVCYPTYHQFASIIYIFVGASLAKWRFSFKIEACKKVYSRRSLARSLTCKRLKVLLKEDNKMTNLENKIAFILTGKQKKFLKGLGHHLAPLITIGKEGLTDNVLKATKQELFSRELIKVKIANSSSINKHEAAEILPNATESTLVQLLGKTLLLYKENSRIDKDQRISLPR